MNNFWTLVRFELKKILSRKITWIAFGIVFGVMLATGVYRVVASHEVDGVRVTAHEEEMQEKAETKKISGRLVNDELVEDMFLAMTTESEENLFAPYVRFYNDIAGELCSNVVLGEAARGGSVEIAKAALGIAPEEDLIYAARRARIEANMEDMRLTEGEKEYWREVLKEETPWVYDYYKGVRFAWVAVYTAMILIALMLAVVLANLFADEHHKKTDQLILSSRNGKRVLYGAKITAGVLFTMVSTGLVLLVTAVPQLALLGLDGWNAPIQIFLPTSTLAMTFGEMMLYVYAVAVIAALLYAAITMCCSELFRGSTVAVLALIVVLVMVPMMVVVPYEYRVLSQIFELNPMSVLSIYGANDLRLIPFFGGYLTMRQAAPVLYLVLIVVCLLIGSRAYRKYQVSGR